MSDINNTPLTPTPAAAWKSTSGAGKTEDVPLPSGNVAKLRRPGMEAFITAGIIPNSLLDIITKQLDKAKGGSKEEFDLQAAEDIFQDPTKFQDVMQLVDNVLVYCVVLPSVKPVSYREGIQAREDLTEAQKEELISQFLYPDMVDPEDKFFIFNYAVGGTRDLERFRTELSANVDHVRSVETGAQSA